MPYKKLKDCWTPKNSVEHYTPPVTMSLPEWRQYISSGNNVLLGSGGVIPNGTVNIPFGGNGAVYSGHVRQGW